MTYSRLQYATLLLSALTATAAAQSAGHTRNLTAKDLIALAQKLEVGASGIQSLQFRVLQGDAKDGMVTIARADQSGSAWIALIDPADGTPIAISAEGRAFVYNVVRGSIEFFDSAHCEFLVYSEGKGLTTYFGFTLGADRVLLDLPAIVAYGSGQPTATRDGELWTLMGTTTRGGVLVAELKPKERFPYSSMQFYAKGQLDAGVMIDRIMINQPSVPPFSRTPDPKELAVDLPVVRIARAAADKAAGEDQISEIIRSFVCRVALRNLMARERAEAAYGRQIDWAAIDERDRRISAKLRKLTGCEQRAASMPPTSQPLNH